MRWLVLVWTVFVAFAPRAGGAQEPRAVRKIEELNRQAMEDYELLEFENARRSLTEAVSQVKKAHLDKHAVAARTYMNLAVVLGAGLGDVDNATLAMVSALTIDPSMKLDKAYKTAELQRVYEEAKSAVNQVGGGAPATTASDPGDDEEPEDAGSLTGLKHQAVDEAKQGRPVPLKVKVGSDLGAKQVVLYYRPPGAAEFSPVVMKSKDGFTYKSEIPASATKGQSVQYYIEAKASGGKVAAAVGNSGSPNIITMVPDDGSGDDEVGQAEDPDNPLPSDGDDDTSVTKGGTVTKHKFFLGVAAGTGGSFVTGITEKRNQAISCCVAFELVNFKPELGFWVSPQTIVSIYARIGLPLDANVAGAAKVAPAALVRVAYAFDPEIDGGVTIHGDFGAGVMRQSITLTMPDETGGTKDTHASGPVLLGGGFGWTKSLGGNARFFLDSTAILGIPVVRAVGTAKPQWGLGVDLNLGLAMAF